MSIVSRIALVLALSLAGSVQSLFSSYELVDFAANGLTASCPRAGSTTSSHYCQCEPGYGGDDALSCIPCAQGNYSTGDGVCVSCPYGMASLFASAACVCDAGFYPEGSSCVPCATSTYKPGVGNNSCLSCHANSATLAQGSLSPESCICDDGFGKSAGSCSQCAAGSYSDAGECAACPVGSTSTQSESASCECQPGYTLVEPSCVACDVGKYKVTTGSAVCSDCPVGTYTASPASTACDSCPAHETTLDVGSTWVLSCVCNAGFERSQSNSSCTGCAAGTYKATIAIDAVCEACPVDTYSTSRSSVDITVCQSCGGNSSTKGLEGRFSPTACMCDAGYEGSSGACTPCALDRYSNLSDAVSECLLCPNGTATLSLTDDAGDCVCKKGFYNTDPHSFCTACPAGKFKAATGNGVCSECPADTYSTAAGASSPNACLPCQNHSSTLGDTARSSETDCVCEDGFSRVNGTCALCPKATWCVQGERHECNTNAESPAGSTSDTACECSPGYYLIGEGCEECPSDHYCPGSNHDKHYCGSNQSAPVASTDIHDCVCDPGFHLLA